MQDQLNETTNITFRDSKNPSVEKNREFSRSRQRILENLSHDPVSSQMTTFRCNPTSVNIRMKQDMKYLQLMMDNDELEF